MTVYTRRGCHLCEDAITVAREVSQERGATLEVLDLDEAVLREPGLAAYSELVPVVLVDGDRVAHWHVREDRLRAALG